MATPCIPDPYVALTGYALARPLGDVSEDEVYQTRAFVKNLQFEDPPLLDKFLKLYPPQNSMWVMTVEEASEAEGLLQCLWRGDYEGSLRPESGPYIHFKGTTYLCYGKALLLQGPKEELAVVYSSKEGEIFVRPLREWVEIVKWSDGKYRPRYVKESAI